MLIALLTVLGIDLIVIVIVVAVLLARRAWESHQPGTFKGAIRVVEGELPGFRPKWKRGFGRWVGEVLVWAKAPSLFRNELVAVDGMTGQVRAAGPVGPFTTPANTDPGASQRRADTETVTEV